MSDCHAKQNAPDSIESRDAPSISPPPKTALTHLTFWSAQAQLPVVTGFWLPKATPRARSELRQMPSCAIIAVGNPRRLRGNHEIGL